MQSRAVDAVDQEIAQAKAESFGRAAHLLQQALAAFAELPAGAAPADRERLAAVAADRVLNVIVQREACGLRDPQYVYLFYRVPREIIARLGIARPSAVEPRQR
jgi:hypothetical protein